MKFFAVLFFFVSANAFCSFPCNWQIQTFFNEAGNVTLSLPNPYTLTIPEVPGLEIICLQRSGPFILNRRGGNIYRCIKIIDVCDSAFVVLQTDLFTLNTPPELCDICTAANLVSTPEVWVATDKTLIGCNVPKNCPVIDAADDSCNGCEPDQPDDGMCCANPKYNKNYYDYSYNPDDYDKNQTKGKTRKY